LDPVKFDKLDPVKLGKLAGKSSPNFACTVLLGGITEEEEEEISHHSSQMT